MRKFIMKFLNGDGKQEEIKKESLNDQLDKINEEFNQLNDRLVQLKKKQNGEIGDFTVVTF